jgi:DNA-binding NtrC family response regulator
VRVVAATNQSVETQIDEGGFREDLFFRLAGIRIEVPPLRERPEDVLVLAARFLAEANGAELAIPADLAEVLRSRPWPGNVRELRNACERLVLLADSGQLRVSDLPATRSIRSGTWLDAIPEELSLIDVEAQVIAHTLDKHGGNVSAAARALRVPRHILIYRIQKYGLGDA